MRGGGGGAHALLGSVSEPAQVWHQLLPETWDIAGWGVCCDCCAQWGGRPQTM